MNKRSGEEGYALGRALDILLDEPEKVARIAVKTRKDYSIVRIGEDNHEMLPDKYDRLQDMKNG